MGKDARWVYEGLQNIELPALGEWVGFSRCRTRLKSFACFSVQSLGGPGTSEGCPCLEGFAYADPFLLLGPCPDHPSQLILGVSQPLWS